MCSILDVAEVVDPPQILHFIWIVCFENKFNENSLHKNFEVLLKISINAKSSTEIVFMQFLMVLLMWQLLEKPYLLESRRQKSSCFFRENLVHYSSSKKLLWFFETGLCERNPMTKTSVNYRVLQSIWIRKVSSHVRIEPFVVEKWWLKNSNYRSNL